MGTSEKGPSEANSRKTQIYFEITWFDEIDNSPQY
jgi:hypothetical protein